MNIDSSIKPMPARRAERSSLKAEILVNRFMCDSLRKGRQGSLIRLLKMSPASFPDVQVHIVDAQARNPYSLHWLWIPGSRGACHRAALCADPLARPGMTGGIDCRNNTAAIRMNRNAAGNPP